jgi:hypothetical protein
MYQPCEQLQKQLRRDPAGLVNPGSVELRNFSDDVRNVSHN